MPGLTVTQVPCCCYFGGRGWLEVLPFEILPHDEMGLHAVTGMMPVDSEVEISETMAQTCFTVEHGGLKILIFALSRPYSANYHRPSLIHIHTANRGQAVESIVQWLSATSPESHELGLSCLPTHLDARDAAATRRAWVSSVTSWGRDQEREGISIHLSVLGVVKCEPFINV